MIEETRLDHRALSAQERLINLARWKSVPNAFWNEAIYTKDQASMSIRKAPRKDHLDRIGNILALEKKVAIPKSRRIMATHRVSAYILEKIIFFPHVFAYWQCQKLEDANHMLTENLQVMYDHLPMGYGWPKLETNSNGEHKQSEFVLVHNQKDKIKSGCFAVAAGKNQLRGKTATIVVLDEFGFQENQEDTLASSKPTIEGGGQLIIISSPALGTTYQLLVFDDL